MVRKRADCPSIRTVSYTHLVKKVFIRSGIRYDYVMADKSGEFIRELARHHVSGELKVAPEHCAPEVLRLMGKPNLDVYERFVQKFEAASRKAGKKQYVLPYFIASHPGSTIACAIELAVYLKRSGFVPDQAQDFYPTPGSPVSYTHLDVYKRQL